MMKILSRLMLIACLVLPFAACKKQEAAAPVEKAAMSAPKTDDRQAWIDYLNDVVPRHMGKIVNQPYVYFLPGKSSADFQDQYDRLAEKAQSDVARGIVRGNLLAYGSPASTEMADLVIAAFQGVPEGSMKGVKLLFIGHKADSSRVEAAVAASGVDYVLVATD